MHERCLGETFFLPLRSQHHGNFFAEERLVRGGSERLSS